MISAYVFSRTIPNNEEKIINKLKDINNIQETHMVFGKFDIVVKVKTETKESLNNIISKEIRKIPNIIRTHTIIVADKTNM